MATNTSIKNQLANRTNTSTSAQPTGFKGIVNSDSVKQRFDEVLKDKAPQFLSSMINMYSGDTYLQKCEPMSIISSCMVAATLDLPVDKNLGYAWVVPYGGKASFQLGYKGYIQLALRTGQYKAINVVEIHEGELIEWNPLTEELQIDFTEKKSDAIIGYAGYFKLVNGFEKTVYWSKEQIENHRKKFSKSDFGWKKDFDAMAKKTVLRNMLSKWGILSIEMQKAYSEDVTPDPVMKDITDDVVMDFPTMETQESEESSPSQPDIVFEQ